MTEEQRALLIPSKVLFELWYATVFHLFERDALDPPTIARMIERRRLIHEKEGNDEIAQLLRMHMHWLSSLEHGKFSPPSVH